jgi:hypothetical protein
MARRGRPRSERAASDHIVYVKLRLYAGEDDDLRDFFGSIPLGLRASTIKEALRSGRVVADQGGLSADEELLDALDSLVDG